MLCLELHQLKYPIQLVGVFPPGLDSKWVHEVQHVSLHVSIYLTVYPSLTIWYYIDRYFTPLAPFQRVYLAFIMVSASY